MENCKVIFLFLSLFAQRIMGQGDCGPLMLMGTTMCNLTDPDMLYQCGSADAKCVSMSGDPNMAICCLAQTTANSRGYYVACETDEQCGQWDNVCTNGYCGCPESSTPIIPMLAIGMQDPSRYFCTKPCSDSTACDGSNHETCSGGSCVCSDGYYRMNTLKCVPMDTSNICKAPAYGGMTCNLDMNVPCYTYAGSKSTCTPSGVCCTEPICPYPGWSDMTKCKTDGSVQCNTPFPGYKGSCASDGSPSGGSCCYQSVCPSPGFSNGVSCNADGSVPCEKQTGSKDSCVEGFCCYEYQQ